MLPEMFTIISQAPGVLLTACLNPGTVGLERTIFAPSQHAMLLSQPRLGQASLASSRFPRERK